MNYCHRCGYPHEIGANFCMNCGNVLDGKNPHRTIFMQTVAISQRSLYVLAGGFLILISSIFCFLFSFGFLFIIPSYYYSGFLVGFYGFAFEIVAFAFGIVTVVNSIQHKNFYLCIIGAIIVIIGNAIATILIIGIIPMVLAILGTYFLYRDKNKFLY